MIKFYRTDGRDHPLPVDVKSADFDLDAALAWCDTHGYTVRRWPTGARVFKGTPWPIRTRGQMQKRRREVETLAARGFYGQDFYWGGLDFAFDM